MPKNIVICCDGTSNEFAQDLTNVVHLYSTLIQDPAKQVAYYHPGLGTLEDSAALTLFEKWVTRKLGMMMGRGLEDDVQKAYTFLVNSYEEGDKVFLFGFSRGAYTVRTLAALLRMYGLVHKGNDSLIPYAFRMFKAINAKKNNPTADGFKLAAKFKATFSTMECKPWFVGVWDTVSSVGWVYNPLRLPYTTSNPDIEIGRHAIAIDERRAFFRTNMWIPNPKNGGPKDLKQVWFPGVHADIGGGYPDKESGLAKIALQWMIKEAGEKGLLVNQERIDRVLGNGNKDYSKPDPNAQIHDSMKGWWLWKCLEYLPLPRYNSETGKNEYWQNRSYSRQIPRKAFIHKSAYQRGEAYKKKLPLDAIIIE